MDRASLLALVVLLVAACGAGCRARARQAPVDLTTVEKWADLPGARASNDVELQAEIEHVVGERGTPRQLVREPPPADQNVAAALAGLFDRDQVQPALDRAAAIFPPEAFEWNDIQLKQAIHFRKAFDGQLEELRVALHRSTCQFSIDYRHGFFADVTFIDVVTLCVRLEAFRVAELLGQDRPNDAVEPLRVMFRLTALLASEKHLAARLAGAHLRADTLCVLAALVEHADTSHDTLLTLYAVIRQQLLNWPADADAWIGDRALTLHSYEVIRAGHLPLLLTAKESESLAIEGNVASLADRVRALSDEDERFYLKAMRAIIEHSANPYHERRETLAAVRRDLHALRNSDAFPFAAGRLFLAGIEQGHRLQAVDRAHCETWALALAMAAGQERPSYNINPLTGIAYRATEDPERVTVRSGTAEYRDVSVPRRPAHTKELENQ